MLRLAVPTWPFYADDGRAKRKRKQWASVGSLVTQPLHLRNLGLRIPVPHDLSLCDK